MKNIIVIDCETTPCDNTLTSVQPTNMLAYDIGWVVCTENGSVLTEKSFVNAEIFFGERDLMKNAFFADKIPQYYEQIKHGSSIVGSWYAICKALADDVKAYGVHEIYAHNMRFDYGALNNTQRWLTKSKYRYFFPYGLKICDTMKMARNTIAKTQEYHDFCHKNNFLTKNGRVRLTAEILYRFISGDMEFVEAHKGLDDVLIEKEIFKYCQNLNPEVSRVLFE